MTGIEASRKAAQELKDMAQILVNARKGQTAIEFKSGNTKILLSFVALANGNITSIIGTLGTPGEYCEHSVWNLNQPPIDPPEIAKISNLTRILATFLPSA
jgi:hypothetical protein